MTDMSDKAAETLDETKDQTVAVGVVPVERASTVEVASAKVEAARERVGQFAANVADRLRNNAELAEERGKTSIADEVVEKIAGIAAREVDGVHDLGGDVARVFASLKERMGFGDADGGGADRGVKVRLDGTTAVIDLKLVVEYGHIVFSVTEAVRARVIGSVEHMLGLEVTEVNITVDDVHLPETA